MKLGKYKTRDGSDAVVLCNDAPVLYGCVVGYIIRPNDGASFVTACAWEDGGGMYMSFEHKDDIMEFVE